MSAPSLTKATGQALHWNYLGSFARLALGMGTNIWFARLLGPGPFGILNVAFIAISLGNLIAGAGMSSALIQREELAPEEIRFCFTCQALLGAAMTLALFVAAPLLAVFFHAPAIVPVLRVFSLVFVLQTLGSTATALLNREHRAKAVQRGNVVSFIVGYIVVGVPMALAGDGVWSLIVAQLVQAAAQSLLNYAAVRHPARPLLDRCHLSFLVFGFRVLGSNLCSWSIINLDNISVGRIAGPIALGVYGRAFALAQTPSDAILTTILQVLLPSLSRIQNDAAKLRRIYAAALGLIVLVIGPGFCAMAAVPGVIIFGLYGSKWAAAAPLFAPLCLAMPVHAAMAISGPLLSARCRPQREMRMQFVTMLIAGAAFVYTVRISVVLMAWTVLAVYLVRFVLLTRAALRDIGGGWPELAAMWPGLLLSAVAACLARGTLLLLHPMPYVPQLATVATVAALGTFAFFAGFSRQLLAPVVSRSPQIRTLLRGSFERFLPLERPLNADLIGVEL